MTQFEEVSCKVLGVMLIVLVIIIGLQLTGCSCPAPQPPSDYMDEIEMKNLA
jgi:hypothetical protein|tara:strand:- start:108 stop:263 length:156 start_codon:yes stop_codon:yes gene_type:complete